MTYSLFTSDSYCCCTTVDMKILKDQEEGLIWHGQALTIVVAREEIFVVVGVPREDFNEIGDEGWDLTL